MLTIVKVFIVAACAAAVFLVPVAILSAAVDMPQSWDEDTGDYVKCHRCDWDRPEKFSESRQPSEACRRCPFCLEVE